MSRENLIAKVDYLVELEEMMAEFKEEAEGIKAEIKAEMEARETEELNLGKYIVRWTSVLTSRFDTKRFKEAFGEDLYKLYTKEVASRRWSVAQ